MIDKFRWIKIIVFLFSPILLALSVNINQELTDSFHEGEYLGNIWAIRDYYLNTRTFPVLVHGAMDFIPSLISLEIWGSDRGIVYTRLINVLATALGWILYISAARSLLGDGKTFIVALFMYSFFWMAASSGIQPLGLQQAFIGTRDVFLVASIFFSIRGVDAKNEIRKILLLCFAGGAAAVSLYWSYDRGIMATVFIGVLILFFLLVRRGAEAGAVFSGYIFCFLLVSFSGIAGTAGENLSNILYWIRYTGEIWYMPVELRMLVIYWGGGIAIFAGFVTGYALFKIYASQFKKIDHIIFGLIAVQVLFLLKLFSLPTSNSFYFVWPSVLIFLAIQSNLRPGISIYKSRIKVFPSRIVQYFFRSPSNILELTVLLVIIWIAAYICLLLLPVADASYFALPVAFVFMAVLIRAGLDGSKELDGNYDRAARFIDGRRGAVIVFSSLIIILSVAYMCLWMAPLAYKFNYTWPVVVVCAVILSGPVFKDVHEVSQVSIGIKNNSPSGLWINNVAYPVSLILTVFATSFLFGEVVKWENVENTMRQILSPDYDNKIVDINHYGMDNLRNTDLDCILQWSNEGIFSYFAKKPFCTKYTYAVYISKDRENEILGEITKAPPKLIVYHSNNWYVSIYGRDMKSRLPLLYNFIIENYQFHENSSGYVFATLK